MAATPSPRRFDNRNIRWQALGDFEHPPVSTYVDELTEKEGERWTF